MCRGSARKMRRHCRMSEYLLILNKYAQILLLWRSVILQLKNKAQPVGAMCVRTVTLLQSQCSVFSWYQDCLCACTLVLVCACVHAWINGRMNCICVYVGLASVCNRMCKLSDMLWPASRKQRVLVVLREGIENSKVCSMGVLSVCSYMHPLLARSVSSCGDMNLCRCAKGIRILSNQRQTAPIDSNNQSLPQHAALTRLSLINTTARRISCGILPYASVDRCNGLWMTRGFADV